MRSTARSAGFTLVEVVVALAIGGLVSLTAAVTAVSVPDIAGQAEARLIDVQRAAAVRGQLRRWLRASYASGDSTYEARFLGVDGPEPGTDALQFPVVDPTATISGRASIVLAVRQDAVGQSSLVAEIQPDIGEPRAIQLARGVTGLEARYLYAVSTEPRWFAGWSSEVERPIAVRLWIHGADLDNLLRLPLTVWLRS